jgi:hypothetical protein
MLKEYTLATHRRVRVAQEGVTIEEPGSELKRITLPAIRWAALLASESQIEESLELLQTQQYVKLNYHIGGGYYVSVTTGFPCVDIRRFEYNPTKKSIFPTKDGIALSLDQWTLFKDIVQQINQDFPELGQTELCLHRDIVELYNCKECHPFDETFVK